jgi:hypothetical protein
MTTFPSPGPAEHPFPLDTGDRVTAAEDVGGFLWPQVRCGTPGVVIGFTAHGLVIVRFRNGRTRQLSADRLRRG